MKKILFWTTLFLILLLLGSCQQKSEQNDWIPLFNGEDLTGWTPKITGYEAGDNYGNTFRVEDGLLKVRYDQYDRFDNRFGHLFYQDELSHYKLR
ncbi:MAG: family 16 glycoside hydrolase, partial [Proteiniphilum sp.]